MARQKHQTNNNSNNRAQDKNSKKNSEVPVFNFRDKQNLEYKDRNDSHHDWVLLEHCTD